MEIVFDIRESDQQESDIPLLFIHGMLGSKEQFSSLLEYFPNRTQIAIDLPSHGMSQVAAGTKLDTRTLATMLAGFLAEKEISQVDIIGYSLGGYVALELAVLNESLVRSIVAHAMKFYWTDEAIKSSLAELGADAIRERSSKAFAELERIHAAIPFKSTLGHSRSIVEGFRDRTLSAPDVRNTGVPVLVSVGDRDELVSLREAARLYEEIGLEQASLAVHANTPHQFHRLPNEAFARSVNIFWKNIDKVRSTSF